MAKGRNIAGEIFDIKELIITYLCDDMTQEEISLKTGYSIKSINRYVTDLKVEYNVKTTHGLIFKYFQFDKKTIINPEVKYIVEKVKEYLNA